MTQIVSKTLAEYHKISPKYYSNIIEISSKYHRNIIEISQKSTRKCWLNITPIDLKIFPRYPSKYCLKYQSNIGQMPSKRIENITQIDSQMSPRISPKYVGYASAQKSPHETTASLGDNVASPVGEQKLQLAPRHLIVMRL